MANGPPSRIRGTRVLLRDLELFPLDHHLAGEVPSCTSGIHAAEEK